MELREYIACLSILYDGSWSDIAAGIKNKVIPPRYDIQQPYITIFDEAYPTKLKQLRFPPWILFYQGDISLLKKPMATIVGSRDIDEKGIAYTKIATNILKKQYVIVSGLAKGVDGMAHSCAIQNGKTIGVIGSGFCKQYPSCHKQLYETMKQEHLILSEYPYHVGVQKYHFPWRNRILAALGDITIVTQAKIQSGTLLTVNEAMNLNKDVYCFPYPYDDIRGKGCNQLIQDGASIIYDLEQLDSLIPH